jgi:ubiquinone/menaquinone biosynthesis C-methylase UbiE
MRRFSWLCPLVVAACAARSEPAKTPPAPPEAHSHSAHGAHHRFDDADRWSRVFDDPTRDAWQKPEAVLDWMALRPNDTVVDLGSGTGYFTTRLARRVPEGKVLAVDIEPKMIEYVRQRAKRDRVDNVEGILGTEDDPKLPDGVHLVLVVDTYHHIRDRTRYFARVQKHLASDGRVVIVDFKQGKLPVGPPDEHKIPVPKATQEMEAAGFRSCGSFDGLEYQYVIAFCKT